MHTHTYKDHANREKNMKEIFQVRLGKKGKKVGKQNGKEDLREHV